MIGKWIDGLTDEQRDRIIEGHEWTAGSMSGYGASRCLVGHAFDYRRNGGFQDVVAAQASGQHGIGVAFRFDALVARFGLNRIVRACKMRAARRNVVVLPDMVRQATR
jgi:hypothetical protein